MNPRTAWPLLKNRVLAELVDCVAPYPTAPAPAQVDACELCGGQVTSGTVSKEEGRERRWHNECVGKLPFEDSARIREAIESTFATRRPGWKSPFGS